MGSASALAKVNIHPRPCNTNGCVLTRRKSGAEQLWAMLADVNDIVCKVTDND
jgi:hypothetical protein